MLGCSNNLKSSTYNECESKGATKSEFHWQPKALKRSNIPLLEIRQIWCAGKGASPRYLTDSNSMSSNMALYENWSFYVMFPIEIATWMVYRYIPFSDTHSTGSHL
jgi:hypothetical protein